MVSNENYTIITVDQQVSVKAMSDYLAIIYRVLQKKVALGVFANFSEMAWNFN